MIDVTACHALLLTLRLHVSNPTRLTKRVVDQTMPPADGSVLFVWDADVKGFGLRVTKAGTKSYVFQYRISSGDTKRKTIGKHGSITVDQAREIARDWYAQARKGGDPAAEGKAGRDAPTVDDLCARYLESHAKRNKRPRSVEGDTDYINRFIKPQFGRKKVHEVTLADIERLADSLGDRRTTANRVVALLSKMFNLARLWHLCERNPTEGWQKNSETRRERFLSSEEVFRLLEAMDGNSNVRGSNIVRMLLLTGARSGEVFSMRWADVDLTIGRWTKPAHTTKQKRTEVIPLSDAATILLREIRKAVPADSPFVFPGEVPGEPMTTIKTFWRSICREAKIEDVRPHDLRHTYASHLASSGQSLVMIGRLLGHSQPQTTARYAHLHDEALRAATNKFSEASGYRRKVPDED